MNKFKKRKSNLKKIKINREGKRKEMKKRNGVFVIKKLHRMSERRNKKKKKKKSKKCLQQKMK